ncbi:cytochrome c [Methylobacterium sp. V23]|jgi:mono/diheme cytochrome c family protein|uniref:cytochrome c n=1 Tax=Methylobacterium sp. V23 TaxID=2044878 RepID=UPI000CDA14D6|nr:cytochrome c [Methylobacterium sp. V23]POR39998.1 hypothetical protein CRT23_26310 [Methylobacterium sp. V23]
MIRRAGLLTAVFLADPVLALDAALPASKAITIPHELPYLPAGPGRAAFVTNCMTCHSPNYVLNQPRFPRKTWKAEVNKMIKVYGAPIPEDQVDAITDYLVSFNGQETGEP